MCVQWWLNKVRETRNSSDPKRAKDTIFGGILASSLPPEDKTDTRLANEAQLVVQAGEGTAGEPVWNPLSISPLLLTIQIPSTHPYFSNIPPPSQPSHPLDTKIRTHHHNLTPHPGPHILPPRPTPLPQRHHQRIYPPPPRHHAPPSSSLSLRPNNLHIHDQRWGKERIRFTPRNSLRNIPSIQPHE